MREGNIQMKYYELFKPLIEEIAKHEKERQAVGLVLVGGVALLGLVKMGFDFLQGGETINGINSIVKQD